MQEEATAYALFEDKHPQPYGIPLTYQSGHLTINEHKHYFLVMQRLGPDLENLILDGTISRRTFLQVVCVLFTMHVHMKFTCGSRVPAVLQYALGMLKAVQSLHMHNLVGRHIVSHSQVHVAACLDLCSCCSACRHACMLRIAAS